MWDSASQAGTDHPSEGLDFSTGHLVASLEGVRGKEEDVLDPSFLLSPHQPFGAVLRLPKEAEGVADSIRKVIRDALRVQSLGQLYSRLFEPAEVRAARILEPSLSLPEPPARPLPDFLSRTHGHRHDEDLPQLLRIAAALVRSSRKALTGCSDRVRVEPHQHQGPVSDLPRQFQQTRTRGCQ